MIVANNISFGYQHQSLLNNVSIRLEPGKIKAIVGPNGSGKTTLMKILAGEIKPHKGDVLINEHSMLKIKPKVLSHLRAVLPQHNQVGFAFKAKEIVALGRLYHKETTHQKDQIIKELSLLTAIGHLVEKPYQNLSGGEQQRVQIARVLAQIWENDQTSYPRYVLLDEPTSSLDLAQQHQIFQVIRHARKNNIGILAIVHDLNLAAQYADEIIFMKNGVIVDQGAVNRVMTVEIIERTLDHEVCVEHDPFNERPFIRALVRSTSNKALQDII